MTTEPKAPTIPPAIYRYEGQPCAWVREGDMGQRADSPYRALAVGFILAAVIVFAVAI